MTSITDVTLTTGWNLPATEIRQKLLDLECSCKQQEQSEVPCEEYFSDGCYGREVFIPKGTCLVGEIHLTEWITIVSRGHIRIVSEEGTSMVDARERPVTFISPAGVKRAGYALEDTWWTMFRATPLTTTEEIRAKHIATDYNQLENHKNVLGSNSSSSKESN
jgi:hypothetical protein